MTSCKKNEAEKTLSLKSFISYLGPALMVSIAYMDPGNYGTDLAAGSQFKYELVWAVWLASFLAMLLQYLSGKIGIATGKSLPELIRNSIKNRPLTIIYWFLSEIAAAATDLAEYLGTVIALNLLFGIPLLYSSFIAALDVILLLAMTSRRFRFIERFFMILVSILVIGLLYQLVIIRPDPSMILYRTFIPSGLNQESLLLVIGIIGATVMPHALYVHSWLSKNKMDMIGMENQNKFNSTDATTETRQKIRKIHLAETIIMLGIAGVVNVGILLISTILSSDQAQTIQSAVYSMSSLLGKYVAVIFVLTLFVSGLTSSTLGTISGQVIMEGFLGIKVNVWLRRVVTRFINVFPTTIAILLGLDPLSILVYSQVALSITIPLPAIPIVYYTSRKKYMNYLVNRNIITVISFLSVAMIIAFNIYLVISNV